MDKIIKILSKNYNNVKKSLNNRMMNNKLKIRL